MNIENKAWWRGTFPSWIVVVLIGLLSWLGLRLIHEHDTVVETTNKNKEQLFIVEFSIRAHNEQLAELKAINVSIRDQLEKLREDVRSASRRPSSALPPKLIP